MALKSRLKMENTGMLAASAFYAVVGISFFIALPMTNFPPHIGLMGVLSLINSYGLLKNRVWTLWVIIVLFFIATTFSVYMLYIAYGKNVFLDLSVIAYFILTWIFTGYTTANRQVLKR